ncbi:MAG: hypothetical protein AAF518_19080 [Spirochaetota bacterium]
MSNFFFVCFLLLILPYQVFSQEQEPPAKWYIHTSLGYGTLQSPVNINLREFFAPTDLDYDRNTIQAQGYYGDVSLEYFTEPVSWFFGVSINHIIYETTLDREMNLLPLFFLSEQADRLLAGILTPTQNRLIAEYLVETFNQSYSTTVTFPYFHFGGKYYIHLSQEWQAYFYLAFAASYLQADIYGQKIFAGTGLRWQFSPDNYLFYQIEGQSNRFRVGEIRSQNTPGLSQFIGLSFPLVRQ